MPTTDNVSAAPALIMGTVFITVLLATIPLTIASTCKPWTETLSGKLANNKAIDLAKSMGFNSTIITVNNPITGNARYLLSPYDNFYYQYTGHIPGGNESGMWTQKNGTYSRTHYWWKNLSKYKIPLTNNMTPEQQAMAKKFNDLFDQQCHIYHAGHPQVVKNSYLAALSIGIVGVLSIIIMVVSTKIDFLGDFICGDCKSDHTQYNLNTNKN